MLLSVKSAIAKTSAMGMALSLCWSPIIIAAGSAQDGPAGITRPIVLPPFNPDMAACAAPPDLRKALIFAQDNERQFMQGAAQGLAKAAKDRGLEYEIVLANNDPKKMIEQLDLAQGSQVGTVVAAPVGPPSLSSSLKR